MTAKAIVYFKNFNLKEINPNTYRSASIALYKSIKWINPDTYYATSNVFLKYYDTYNDEFSSITYNDINYKGETYVITNNNFLDVTKTFNPSIAYSDIERTIDASNNLWIGYANVFESYRLNLGYTETLFFTRFNSNIYKNIFETQLFDLYNLQTKIFISNTKENIIFQYNHGFNLYDLVYINNKGIYCKALAIEDERRFVCGMISQIIDENKFIITSYGKVELIEPINNIFSDSTILYLSDSEEGKFCVYEDIISTLYTPIGFYTDNSIIISIMDSSVGLPLQKYQDHYYDQNNFVYLSESDINDVVQEVLNNS